MLDSVSYTINTSMASTSFFSAGEKKHWWQINKRIVDKYLREAKVLIANREQTELASAINLLDAALVISPRLESALELKAKSLLYLRRHKDVADMLQDYIPSVKIYLDDTTTTTTSSSSSHSSDNSSSTILSKEQAKLLSSAGDEPSVKCFSVSDLKNKVLSGLSKSCEKEDQWRYLVLGQACCHLGLMEDALVLLQTGKRLASAAFRRESICWSEDSFFFKELPSFNDLNSSSTKNNSPPKTESENISQILSQIKLLLRRKTAAIAALDSGLYSESIRHFSKIVDGRRGAPQTFLAECYNYRASAYRSAGRIAEAIADCNKTLALDPSCIDALRNRASLFESINCFADSLHDLEHLKLLYNSILHDRKLPGPFWKRRQGLHYTEIQVKKSSLSIKMQELKQKIASGETRNVDYYSLIGIERGCSRSELERAHLLLTLKHKPDRSSGFIERIEFDDDCDVGSIRDRARVSALMLFRLIQKGYTSVMTTIISQETAANPAPAIQLKGKKVIESHNNVELKEIKLVNYNNNPSMPLFQGVFCRDLAVIGNLLSQRGFNLPNQVKYEALSC